VQFLAERYDMLRSPYGMSRPSVVCNVVTL